jgi:hypothetical protein
VGQKKRKASSGPKEAQGQQWARRSARPAVGQKKRKASSGPKEAQGQQWARRSACQKANRPRPGDLTKKNIETEKFQPLEQKKKFQQGVGCLQVLNRTQKTALVAEKHNSLQKGSRRQKRLREQENQPREQ